MSQALAIDASWFAEAAMPQPALPLRSRPMLDRSDEELMLAYAGGEARAFETLYTRHRGTVYRFLLRSVSRRDLADELFQDTWSRVISARDRYRPDAKFSTWLLQIAHNLLVDGFRRQRPEENGEQAELAMQFAENDEGERPDRVLTEFEQSRQLQKALAALPDDQRGAFLLRVESGLSIEEIAEVTQVGRETAKSRLRYALEKLREALGS
jgi:RNA polymerase sigma-70 factor (ECF subfamily)